MLKLSSNVNECKPLPLMRDASTGVGSGTGVRRRPTRSVRRGNQGVAAHVEFESNIWRHFIIF